MISYSSGDIFTLTAEDCEAIVVPTNCKGVFGAGMAKDLWDTPYTFGGTVRRLYGGPCGAYKRACEAGDITPGSVRIYTVLAEPAPWHLLLAATKDDWKDPSQMEWVDKCADGIIEIAKKCGITKIALPLLGAGLGGLPAKEVGALLRRKFKDETAISAMLYIPASMLIRQK